NIISGSEVSRLSVAIHPAKSWLLPATDSNVNSNASEKCKAIVVFEFMYIPLCIGLRPSANFHYREVVASI
ncbi:TPA: hypothetical protein ACNAC2_005278, partial [Klebsiella quasipneumoniae]